jgi:hypothetical protein
MHANTPKHALTLAAASPFLANNWLILSQLLGRTLAKRVTAGADRAYAAGATRE